MKPISSISARSLRRASQRAIDLSSGGLARSARKLTLCYVAVLVFAAANVFASEDEPDPWKPLQPNETFAPYLHIPSIEQDGTALTVWELWMYHEVQTITIPPAERQYQIKSSKRKIQYGCNHNTYRRLSESGYPDALGQTEPVYTLGPSVVRDIPPDTRAEQLLKEACEYLE